MEQLAWGTWMSCSYGAGSLVTRVAYIYLNIFFYFAVLNAVGRRVEEIKKEMTCKVCLMNPVQRAFRACGHLCACADCIKQLRECPICRSPVDRGVIVVNLPKPKKRMTVDHELFLKRNNYFGLDCVAGNPRAVRWVIHFPWCFCSASLVWKEHAYHKGAVALACLMKLV